MVSPTIDQIFDPNFWIGLSFVTQEGFDFSALDSSYDITGNLIVKNSFDDENVGYLSFTGPNPNNGGAIETITVGGRNYTGEDMSGNPVGPRPDVSAGDDNIRWGGSEFVGSIDFGDAVVDLSNSGGTSENFQLGSSDDTIQDASAGDDTILGGGGDDTINGGFGSDSLFGESGNDYLSDGGAFDQSDLLDGGSGNDTLVAGGGDDVLIGGAGTNTATGGAGDDTFVYTSGEVLHVTDFGDLDGVTGVDAFTPDGTPEGNDFLDLSSYYSSASELRSDLADGILDGSGATGVTALTGQITGLSVSLATASNEEIEDQFGVTCFAANTQILTEFGEKPVQDLRVGDKIVVSGDHAKAIQWIGSRNITSQNLEENENLRPVRIRANALSVGVPKRDLLVSRQHRLVVSSKIANRMFGTPQVLVSAIRLTELPGIYVDEHVEDVEYFHFLFDTHEVVFSEGAPTESLYIGPHAIQTMAHKSRNEILTLFPELCDEENAQIPVLPIPCGKRQKKLVARHVTNETPILSTFGKSPPNGSDGFSQSAQHTIWGVGFRGMCGCRSRSR